MPRTPREAMPDGPFHVMSHAVEGVPLFRRDADRRRYLGLLQLAVERCDWRVLTFALMDTHLHLLVDARPTALSDGLWWLNWRYALYYKARYDPHFGHVFGGRPRMKPIDDDRYLLAVARYVALNPVGVVCDRPEDYRWSAHRALIGAAPTPPFLAGAELLRWFGRLDPIARYRELVDGGVPEYQHDVLRWAARGQTPSDRPALADLLADPSPSSIATAHHDWGYSLRAISAATSLSFYAVRAAAGQDRSGSLAP